MSDSKFIPPNIVLPKIDVGAATRQMAASIDRDMRLIAEANAAKHQRELEIHEATLRIADNTQGINDLVSLVRQGNEIHQQTFALLQEMQTIMTAQSPEEAETILRQVLNKATQANEDFSTIQSLIGYGKMLGKLIFPDSSFFD